jgi:hypothetical protein
MIVILFFISGSRYGQLRLSLSMYLQLWYVLDGLIILFWLLFSGILICKLFQLIILLLVLVWLNGSLLSSILLRCSSRCVPWGSCSIKVVILEIMLIFLISLLLLPLGFLFSINLKPLICRSLGH